jgi:hypothetical protein
MKTEKFQPRGNIQWPREHFSYYAAAHPCSLGYAHTGAYRTQRTDAAHGDKIFFLLLAMRQRTLIRTGRNGARQFRLGGGGIFFTPAAASG